MTGVLLDTVQYFFLAVIPATLNGTSLNKQCVKLGLVVMPTTRLSFTGMLQQPWSDNIVTRQGFKGLRDRFRVVITCVCIVRITPKPKHTNIMMCESHKAWLLELGNSMQMATGDTKSLEEAT